MKLVKLCQYNILMSFRLRHFVFRFDFFLIYNYLYSWEIHLILISIVVIIITTFVLSFYWRFSIYTFATSCSSFHLFPFILPHTFCKFLYGIWIWLCTVSKRIHLFTHTYNFSERRYRGVGKDEAFSKPGVYYYYAFLFVITF